METNSGGRIIVFDTTLRDGEQTPGVNLSATEKLEIARQLARLGVDVIEAGFPVTSQGDMKAVAAIAENVEGPVIAGLARTNPIDIEKAWEAVKYAKKPRIHTFIATSEVHMKYKLRKNPEEVVAMTRDAVSLARSLCQDVEFSAEDATRSDPEFLYRVFEEAIAAGATTINVPDTVGYTTPNEFRSLISGIKKNVRGIERVVISVHCHDDLGLAVANSLAAIEMGATQVECTINGIGERAGNTALEEVVMALKTRRDHFESTTNVVTEQIYRTSRLVSGLTGMVVQHNKAIIGSNAFAHQSGIHQDGVLKKRSTYEIMTPESIGLPASRIVMGKVSGRHAFQKRLEELGYSVTSEEVDRLFLKFKEMADRKKDISDRDIEAIVENTLYAVPEEFSLIYHHVSSGNQTVPTATVRVAKGEAVMEEASSGEGPVDAVFKAIDRITNFGPTLVDYSLKAVTSGKDALGEATLKVEYCGNIYGGRGVSTDVIEASAKAYLTAMNRIAYEISCNQRNGNSSRAGGEAKKA